MTATLNDVAAKKQPELSAEAQAAAWGCTPGQEEPCTSPVTNGDQHLMACTLGSATAGSPHDQKNRACRYPVSVFEARVDRVLGAGPFCEIGQPRVTATSPDGALIAVGGSFFRPQWHGRDVSRRSQPDPGWHRSAVYRSDDLTCLFLVTMRWPANALAFHPTLPLLAIGTGAYDGGWSYEGELLLLDLSTGATVSLLEYPREVRQLTWQDPETLALVLAIPCDEDEKTFGTTALACTIRRDDWDRATAGMLQMPYGEEPHADESRTDPAVAAAVVDQLCMERGLAWTPRREVWAVQALADGRVLAALGGVALECWTPTSPDCAWRCPPTAPAAR